MTALKQAKVIKEANSSEVLKDFVCSTSNEDCMMSKCKECKEKEIIFHNETDFKVKYAQWKNVKEMKIIKNAQKTIKKRKN